ncbi:MAG TPA: ATP-binding protein [Rhizobacter sp.]
MLLTDITVTPGVQRTKRWPRISWTLLAVVACVALGVLSYRLLLDARLLDQQQAGARRLEFYTLTLDALLTRHEVLPGVLALEHKLAAVLDSPDDAARDAANLFLEAAAARAQVNAIYVMDATGMTLAASNWNRPISFVGRSYGFRPYFRDSMDGHLGRFYGVGATSGDAGYFLATQIRTPRGAIGVVAVKVDLEGFEQAMRQSGETVLLADQEGVVFLGSVPEWKYRALAPLSQAVRERLQLTRQYGSAPLLPISEHAASRSRLGAPGAGPRGSIVIEHPIGPLGWQVLLLVDPQEAHRAAAAGALVVALSGGLLFALAGQWDLRRRRRHDQRAAEARLRAANADLEGRIAQRTVALSEANVLLERKITELKQAEAIVRQTQDRAVQAGKLAVLGQLSAGMSHELNQPLTALRTLSDNGAKLLAQGRIAETRENLELIGDVAARMGRTITQLKAFARKESPSLGRVELGHVVAQAMMLVEPRRAEIGATIDTQGVAAGLRVKADETRLVQVLVNLLRNGLDEVAGLPRRQVTLVADRAAQRVMLRVRDSGPGIAPDVLPHLFEPFYTTKPAGQGLGLGLALSLAITESMGGRLQAQSHADGAEFSIALEEAA